MNGVEKRANVEKVELQIRRVRLEAMRVEANRDGCVQVTYTSGHERPVTAREWGQVGSECECRNKGRPDRVGIEETQLKFGAV